MLQRSIMQYLRLVNPDCLYFFVPNGGKRGKAEAGRFKAMGVRPGVPDLVFIWRDGEHQRIGFVELKAPGRSARLSAPQKQFKADCLKIGAAFEVVQDLDRLMTVLRSWGLIR